MSPRSAIRIVLLASLLLCLPTLAHSAESPADQSGSDIRIQSVEPEEAVVPCSPWLFAPIGVFDEQYRLPVVSNDSPDNLCTGSDDWSTDTPGLLFDDLPPGQPIDPSYEETCNLCDQFDRAQDTGDYTSLDPAIRLYLDQVAQMKPLAYALGISGTTVDDLYQTWFGPAQGFQHAICGEKDKANLNNTGGYHFWYRFYQEERRQGDGHVNFRCAIEGEKDPGVATIRFDWNPLGNDDYRQKPIGGFTTGNSVAAMLALGHLARVSGCDVSEGGNDLVADINGHAYEWVLVLKDNSLLSLYPKALDHTLPRE